MFEAMEIGREKIRVSHLQYANVTIFTCFGKLDNIFAIKDILRIFKLLSGFKVNFNKCSLMDLNVDRENLAYMTDILGCEVGLIHFSYLGLNVGNHRRVASWDKLLDKIRRRLASWNDKHISLRVELL
ncbi:hypothetical protein ACS0TY_015669 [Phlomoides rotata]